jgi:Rod binding domain-containing protein
MLVIVALIAALTAFFAGLKDLSAKDYSPQKYTQDEIEAAQGMEAMMASILIEQMRKSVPDSEFMPKSSGERIFESLLDYEYAQTMSRAGTFGITDLVLAEMRRNR